MAYSAYRSTACIMRATPNDERLDMDEILVMGATGQTGRPLVRALAAGAHAVRAASRTPGEPSPGVTPVRLEWFEPDTYGRALEGVKGLYLVLPTLRLDYAPRDREFLEAARAAGVTRVVMLSARGVDEAEGTPFRDTEHAVMGSGMDWAILRPTWFAQNLTDGELSGGLRAQGVLALPAGDGVVPLIDVEDIAAVAAAVLTGAAPTGRAYTLTGPEDLSFGQAVSALAEATGRQLTYVDVPQDEWVRGAVEHGLPADYAGLLAALLGEVRAGRAAGTTGEVREVTGRPPTAFAEVARREAAALVPAA
jgi:uncharacterized protein YbjT (DUF2867 family)